jgi:hypothetical protein
MTAEPLFVFTPERQRTLAAVVERILPGTDGPGARETAVATALERALQHRFFLALRGAFEQWLDLLDAQARQRDAKAFAACGAGDQDELLRAIEQGPNPWTRVLFRSLIALSLEGLLGDPIHGGNTDFRGWAAIGLQPDDVRSGLCRGERATP